MEQKSRYLVNYFSTDLPSRKGYLQYRFRVFARTWREARAKADARFVTEQFKLRREVERLDD